MRLCHLDHLDLPQPVTDVVRASLATDAHWKWPLGRNELSQGCFVMVEDGETRTENSARFEAHNRYVDLQLVIGGESERMQWIKREGLKPVEDLLEANDLLFFAEPSTGITNIEVAQNQMAVFMPNDAHKPSLHVHGSVRRRRKYVYKIPCALFKLYELAGNTIDLGHC